MAITCLGKIVVWLILVKRLEKYYAYGKYANVKKLRGREEDKKRAWKKI